MLDELTRRIEHGRACRFADLKHGQRLATRMGLADDVRRAVLLTALDVPLERIKQLIGRPGKTGNDFMSKQVYPRFGPEVRTQDELVAAIWRFKYAEATGR